MRQHRPERLPTVDRAEGKLDGRRGEALRAAAEHLGGCNELVSMLGGGWRVQIGSLSLALLRVRRRVATSKELGLARGWRSCTACPRTRSWALERRATPRADHKFTKPVLNVGVSLCGLPLRGGLLVREARGGQLEQLSCLHARGCAWEPCKSNGRDPCSSAAKGGHLGVLQWLRANGCLWDVFTPMHATTGGHLDMLKWLHANEWLPVGQNDMHLRSSQWAPGCAVVAACQWLLVGGVLVLVCS
jgi:hypothetical protein